MSTTAAKKLAMKALQLFPPFRWDDQQEDDWIEDVMRETAHFSDEVLDRATAEMVRTRKRKDGTPAVSDCIRYCVEVKRWIDAEKNKGELPMGEKPSSGLDWTADRLKLATDLCMSPMGREAAKEGWVQQLHDFARKNSRLPQPNEIGALKREAKAFDEAYARCVKGGWPQAEKLERLGAMMLKRREDLVDRVLHGVVG